MSISYEMLENFDKRSLLSPESNVIMNAVIKNGIKSVTLNNDPLKKLNNIFSNDIKTGKITSQGKSGRCWLFAGLNMLRRKTAEKLKLKDFEFSQNFLMFYDKLEKANYFLGNISETENEDIYSRIIMWLMKDPLQDGGQWDMFNNLIKNMELSLPLLCPIHSTAGNRVK